MRVIWAKIKGSRILGGGGKKKGGKFLLFTLIFKMDLKYCKNLNLPKKKNNPRGGGGKKQKKKKEIYWGGGNKMGANISMYTVCFKSD